MIDNRSAKHPAEQETVDGRSADECLRARTAGVPQGLARGTFGGILSPFGRVRLRRRAADPQGRPCWSEGKRKETGGSPLARRCTFSLSERRGGALPFPRGSRRDSDCEFLKSISTYRGRRVPRDARVGTARPRSRWRIPDILDYRPTSKRRFRHALVSMRIVSSD